MNRDVIIKERPRLTHIFPANPDGFYCEPEWVSRRLFEVELFGAPGARVLDPACGWGRIPLAAAAAGYSAIASDIVDRRNGQHGLEHIPFTVCAFLRRSPVGSTWSIVTNPPFQHVREFVEHALEVATYKTAVLVPLRRMPAARWLQRLPLESVHRITPRPSMLPGS
jgi:predicted RNA methylase